MDHDHEQQVIDALNRKSVDLPCPRCGHNDFSLIGGANLALAVGVHDLEKFAAAVVACRKCGFLSYHALGWLLNPNPLRSSTQVRAETEGVGLEPVPAGAAAGSADA